MVFPMFFSNPTIAKKQKKHDFFNKYLGVNNL